MRVEAAYKTLLPPFSKRKCAPSPLEGTAQERAEPGAQRIRAGWMRSAWQVELAGRCRAPLRHHLQLGEGRAWSGHLSK